MMELVKRIGRIPNVEGKKRRFSARYLIYLASLIGLIAISSYYAWIGYFHDQALPAVADGNDLLGRIFTPFVLALVRFVIVFLIGLSLLLILLSKPLQRIKVMQVELDFSNDMAVLASVQEKQFNQLSFLSQILQKNDHFLSMAVNAEDVPSMFKGTMSEIMKKYEELFEEIGIDITTETHLYIPGIPCFEKRDYNRLMERLANEPLPGKKITFKKKTLSDTALMMGVRQENGFQYVVAIESRGYEFQPYDKEMLECFFDYTKTICDTASLIE